jgi:DNA repair exonuclease SbcCD ATPase subunit
MADMINLDQKLEVRDASGKTVGFFLSESTLRELMAEQDRMRQELARLRQIQEELEKEREEYQMSCTALGEMYQAAMEMVDPKALEQRSTSFDRLIQELDNKAGTNE